MGALEDAREENRRLKAEAEVRSDFSKREAETKAVKRENFALRHPGLMNVAGRVGTGFKRMGGAIADAGKAGARNAGRKGPNFANNFGRNMGMKMPRFRM